MVVLAMVRDPDTATSDTELMAAVRDGDLVQLGVLFERHHVGLFNFFLRLTGNRQLSEDLVQEAFIRILKYRKSFRIAGPQTSAAKATSQAGDRRTSRVDMRHSPEGSSYGSQPGDFRPWLYKLARNAVAAHFRKHGRDHLPPGEPEERVCGSPLALEEMQRVEDARLLRAALLRLPYERREVLLLSRFGELRYDQIAELLGCSVGAVKLRVHRAVRQLREVFDGLAGRTFQ
jgi:RNA polymerase sigma factor (sigma-70 family)